MPNSDWSLTEQGLDPASHRCRWRTLGLFLDPHKTQETIALLERLNIRPSDILVLTRRPVGGLPPVNWVAVTWAVPGMCVGIGVGFLIGALVWLLTAHFLLEILVLIFGTILGGVMGWSLGVQRPRALIQPFWRDIQQGSYLVLIYATQSAHQRVLHPVRGMVGNLYEARELVGPKV